MTTYKNYRPSIVGLNHASGEAPRMVGPGEVFDANADEIPKGLLDTGWIRETNEKPPAKVAAGGPQAVAQQPGLGSSADQPDVHGIERSPSDTQAHAANSMTSTGTAADRSAATRGAEQSDTGTPDAQHPGLGPGSTSAASSTVASSGSSAYPNPDDETKSAKKHK